MRSLVFGKDTHEGLSRKRKGEMKHGCFNCGEIDGETYENDSGVNTCSLCDCTSIVELATALDIIREVALEGNLPTYLDEMLHEVELEGE